MRSAWAGRGGRGFPQPLPARLWPAAAARGAPGRQRRHGGKPGRDPARSLGPARPGPPPAAASSGPAAAFREGAAWPRGRLGRKGLRPTSPTVRGGGLGPGKALGCRPGRARLPPSLPFPSRAARLWARSREAARRRPVLRGRCRREEGAPPGTSDGLLRLGAGCAEAPPGLWLRSPPPSSSPSHGEQDGSGPSPVP